MKKIDLETRRLVFCSKELKIYEKEENILLFDYNNDMYTHDVLEAVSNLMRIEDYENSTFWNLKITEEMTNYIRPLNSLYYLSSGENFWKKVNVSWIDSYENLELLFEHKLIDMVNMSYTLRELRHNLRKHFNLDIFYNFTLAMKEKREA